MIRTYDGMTPEIADSAYVDDAAVVIGDVTIGEEASVWPGVVLRGDSGHIEIGPRTNLQDNAICHEPVEIGPDVTVGHTAIVHACTVEERAVIGMGATVLDDSVIGDHSIVGAGSVVTEGTDVRPYTLVVGTPAEEKMELDSSDWFEAADHYVELAKKHSETSDVLPEHERT